MIDKNTAWDSIAVAQNSIPVSVRRDWRHRSARGAPTTVASAADAATVTALLLLVPRADVAAAAAEAAMRHWSRCLVPRRPGSLPCRNEQWRKQTHARPVGMILVRVPAVAEFAATRRWKPMKHGSRDAAMVCSREARLVAPTMRQTSCLICRLAPTLQLLMMVVVVIWRVRLRLRPRRGAPPIRDAAAACARRGHRRRRRRRQRRRANATPRSRAVWEWTALSASALSM